MTRKSVTVSSASRAHSQRLGPQVGNMAVGWGAEHFPQPCRKSVSEKTDPSGAEHQGQPDSQSNDADHPGAGLERAVQAPIDHPKQSEPGAGQQIRRS